MASCNHDWERIHPIKIETMIQNLVTKYPNQAVFINEWFYDKYLPDGVIHVSVCLNCEEVRNKPKEIYSEIIPLLKERDKRRELALSIYEKHKEVCNG